VAGVVKRGGGGAESETVSGGEGQAIGLDLGMDAREGGAAVVAGGGLLNGEGDAAKLGGGNREGGYGDGVSCRSVVGGLAGEIPASVG
jgi:hypothetical protein